MIYFIVTVPRGDKSVEFALLSAKVLQTGAVDVVKYAKYSKIFRDRRENTADFQTPGNGEGT